MESAFVLYSINGVRDVGMLPRNYVSKCRPTLFIYTWFFLLVPKYVSGNFNPPQAISTLPAELRVVGNFFWQFHIIFSGEEGGGAWKNSKNCVNSSEFWEGVKIDGSYRFWKKKNRDAADCYGDLEQSFGDPYVSTIKSDEKVEF